MNIESIIEDFKDFLYDSKHPKSNKPHSYKMAIQMVFEFLDMDSISTQTVSCLQRFNEDLKSRGKTYNKFSEYSLNRKSYLEKGFVFAAIPQFCEFLIYDMLIQAHQDNEEPKYSSYLEGKPKEIKQVIKQRNRAARADCLAYNGFSCKICGFNFEDVYGDIGKNFIEVHHINEMSAFSDEIQINPETDLIPVCSNCHSMLHRKKPAYSVEDIIAMGRFRELP